MSLVFGTSIYVLLENICKILTLEVSGRKGTLFLSTLPSERNLLWPTVGELKKCGGHSKGYE